MQGFKVSNTMVMIIKKIYNQIMRHEWLGVRPTDQSLGL